MPTGFFPTLVMTVAWWEVEEARGGAEMGGVWEGQPLWPPTNPSLSHHHGLIRGDKGNILERTQAHSTHTQTHTESEVYTLACDKHLRKPTARNVCMCAHTQQAPPFCTAHTHTPHSYNLQSHTPSKSLHSNNGPH